MAMSVTDIVLDKIANREYYKYGVATIEDRAIPGTTDGLKPVIRRALWATYKLGINSKAKHVKSARIVGETLGKYHPHGDMACYEAIVTAANSPQRMVDGDGNWGTALDNAAAHRYTNMRLSSFADAVFFDPFYKSTVQMIPNYDGSDVEPLNLVTLLPNTLINGNFGIATGVRVSMPSFTAESVIRLVKLGLKRKVTAKDCLKHLVFTSENGAHVNPAHPDNAELLLFFKNGKGKARFNCDIAYDAKTSSFRITSLPPMGLTGAIEKVSKLPCIATINDDSSVTDQYPLSYKVTLKKGTTELAREATLKKIDEAFSSLMHFDVKVTDRSIDEDGKEVVKLRSATVPGILNEWVTYRLKLEAAACRYHMKVLDERIARVDLLMLAIQHLDYIVSLMKNKKISDEQMVELLAKRLKVTTELAAEVFEFRIRQLRALESSKLIAARKELIKEKKTLNTRRKQPAPHVLGTLPGLVKMAHTNFTAKLEAAKQQMKRAKSK